MNVLFFFIWSIIKQISFQNKRLRGRALVDQNISEYEYISPKLMKNAYNQIMSVTIKVLFGEKLYRLSPGVTTMSQVGQQMKQRFPEIQQLRYYYEDQEVEQLTSLIAQVRKQGKNSLKLTAKADNAAFEALSSCGISKINQSNSEIKLKKFEVSELFEVFPESKETEKKDIKQKEKEDIKFELTLPSDFYLCFNCLGNGSTKESGYVTLCPICRGKGKLEDNHKYVQRMKELYQTHFHSENRNNSELSQKKECPRKSSILGMDKSYEVIVSEVNKKDKVEINKLFTVRFEIKNEGEDWTQKEIQVIECGSTEGRRVSALKKGDKMVIEMGPFVCKNESVLEKTYSLCYKEGEELIRFGHKFGFTVKGVKKSTIKKNDSLLLEKERIRDLKMLSGSNKSEEYIGMKLKSLGIDLLNLQMEDELILELIRQLK